MMKTESVTVVEKVDIYLIGALIANADFSLAMRLHAAICSAASGVPTLAISYDDKVRNFVSENSVGEYIEIADITPEALVEKAEKAMKTETSNEMLSRLRAGAAKNIELALALL